MAAAMDVAPTSQILEFCQLPALRLLLFVVVESAVI